MEKLNMYQVCYTTDGKGKNRKVTATETVNGESLVDVYTAISERDDVTTPFVVYPLATLDSGESVYMLADYVAKQYNKWKLRNNAAVIQYFCIETCIQQMQNSMFNTTDI